MENTSNRNTVSNSDSENHWQQAENEENKTQEPNDQKLDLRSAEANGFGTGEDLEEHSIYASSYDDPEEGDDEDEEDDDEEDSTDRDWGTVDPQEHPGIPSDMDPSGPGSAV
ncbi:hypothetical protein FNO01nite_25550 [Flavobacterium noncentrifugens]|uniref:Uncharacterized protein n=1 Tax=Flavobacterium noncentrifugens TaxID=1128970 RepID=A0A1G8ZPE6_9FLAO|nr:hypothetical protein [Flavobacterium noncentrifugens]GEP51883.1 hypothetical protein FNO01nite_25550 [Flavobacterium noncentrifugens]SDK16976.1 hypothetical protein SAMN04487935_2687 [Flavobacterium noncentrifugens]